MKTKNAKDVAFEFVQYFCKQICQNKEDIDIQMTDDEKGTFITIVVNPSDMGRLIGTNGQTIASLRLLVRRIGFRDKTPIAVKVLDSR